ncbi:MAG: helicase-related protein [Gemmatimonadaceae bacterium]
MSRIAVDEAQDRLDVARATLAEFVTIDAPSPTLGSVVLRPDQLETVCRVRAHLRRDGGCLLADDVGTGKTYVALAVARQWARPLVVLPASLQPTWERAAHCAGVRCDFTSHEALSRGHAVDQRFDGVVVDESHRFRPTSRRHAALAALTAHAPMLMLSATPLQNNVRELAAQIALLVGEVAYLLPPAELARWVVRSSHSAELPLPRVAPPRWLPIDADDGEVLRAILALPPPPRAIDAGEGGVLLQLSLVRAWASSRAALAAAVRRRQHTLAAIEQCHQEGRQPSRRELGSWSGAGGVQLGFATLLAASFLEMSERTTLADAIERERAGLDALRSAIARVDDPDPKRVSVLRGLRRAHEGEAILAFSESATTVRAYWSALRGDAGCGMLTAREARIASGRLGREELLARFAPRAQGARPPAAHERVTLLLATDLLSEGVNLQDASVVVHLDLPWNPARLAQRLGRIRRPGGAREVASYLLSPPAQASLLLRTEARLRAKLARAESTIGRSVDVLPTLGAPGLDSREGAAREPAAMSAAELRGEIARRLARWRMDLGPGVHRNVGVGGTAIEAAVHADASGWIALLDDGRLVASVANCEGRAIVSDASETIVRALHFTDGAPRLADPAERDAADRELRGWIAHDWTQRSSGIAVVDSPMRRRIRRALDDALRSTPRHRRASIMECAARVRRALTRPLPLGLERTLTALADERSTQPDWIDAAADLVALAPSRAPEGESGAPRYLALIVFGRAASARP